uniref:Amidase domain-containing protein n=1 Tax=Angiostrongylus cantonensis TaxID=6313 RepID=A0A0K0D2J3_ANGCA
MSIAATYTALFNLLDFPAGVVPVGKVAAKDDKDLVNESTYPVVNCSGHNVVLRIIRDSSINSVGLPLSVQIVTLPFEEEKCLRIMREVEGVWSDDCPSKEGTPSEN